MKHAPNTPSTFNQKLFLFFLLARTPWPQLTPGSSGAPCSRWHAISQLRPPDGVPCPLCPWSHHPHLLLGQRQWNWWGGENTECIKTWGHRAVIPHSHCGCRLQDIAVIFSTLPLNYGPRQNNNYLISVNKLDNLLGIYSKVKSNCVQPPNENAVSPSATTAWDLFSFRCYKLLFLFTQWHLDFLSKFVCSRTRAFNLL